MEVNFTNDPPSTKLIVNYIPLDVAHPELYNLFETVGNVISINIIRYRDGRSKGYGFIEYDSLASAVRAVQTLNRIRMRNKVLRVSFAKPRMQSFRDTTIFVRNVPMEYREHDLFGIVRGFGQVTSIKIIRRYKKCFAFIRFAYKVDADKAVRQRVMTVTTTTGAYRLYIELSLPAMKSFSGAPGHTMFVYNMPQNITRSQIAAIFRPFGTIQHIDFIYSCRRRYLNYIFVKILCPNAEFVARALSGYKIGDNKLQVTLHRRY